MTSLTVQLAGLLLAAFVLGLGVGYLLWIRGWRRRIDGDAARLPALTDELADARRAVDERDAQLEALHSDVEERDEQLTAAQAQVTSLEGELSAARETASPPAEASTAPVPTAPAPSEDVEHLRERVEVLTRETEGFARLRADLEARSARADEFRRRARRAEAQARRLRTRLAAEQRAADRGGPGADAHPDVAATDLGDTDLGDTDVAGNDVAVDDVGETDDDLEVVITPEAERVETA